MNQKHRLSSVSLLLFFIPFYASAPILTPSSAIFLTNDDIKSGYTASEIGAYLILTKSLFLKDNFTIDSSTEVNGEQQSNILISITQNNVTLDLNNQSIKTDKPGHIAIAIKDGLSGIVIKNGSIINGLAHFHSAILIGRNCSNITLENITIEGGSDNNHAILDFKGHPLHPINNINLKNISIYNSATPGIRCSHAQNIYLENIVCSSIHSNRTLAAIDLINCKYIFARNIKSTLHQGTGETIGFKIENCKDVKCTNILSSSNEDFTAGACSKNIVVRNSYNVQLDQIESTNTINTHYGIGIIDSKQITLKNAIVCNNQSGDNSAYSGIYIVGSDSIVMENCSISNCTSETDFNGILCDTTTCSDISLKNIEISANAALNGNFVGVHLTKSEFIVLDSLIISQNRSTRNMYGLKTTNDTKNLFCNNSQFVYNKSTTSATDTIVAGLYIDGTVGVRLENCLANYNNGAAQAVGFFILRNNACEIKNCKAQLNWASTSIAQAKCSAGFYLYACNYCSLKDCNALHNKGGNYAAGTGGGDSVNLTTCCGGFGLINHGVSLAEPNIGNQCTDCVFDGNGNQLANVDPGVPHKSYSGGRRYWPSQALAAGAIDYFSRQTAYKKCYFNNNGLSNYVFSSGLIVCTGSVNILVDECSAANNRFYGYTDLNASCETYFLQSLTLGNGSYNSVAIAVTATQSGRNLLIVYPSRKNPFYTINMDDYSAITSSNSKMHNYNIIGRK